MKLLRLALENWRGVAAREITFDDGVTLIEGPNEIGKSTLVEALLTLIDELDSSAKKSVKAIQPVGRDVGSRVEAEFITGDYHLVYSKTFNRGRQTELRILAPRPEQLTGREAHERVGQILQSTVDMGLWHALMAEQGREITGVHLADCDGLARALDEAAGGAVAEEEDGDLFTGVQAEYERYFTLKTGRSRFAELETRLASARERVEEARAALAAIETDRGAFERCAGEIQRLAGSLPELKAARERYQADWQVVSALRQELASREAELDSARQLLQAAADNQARREALVAELETCRAALEEKRASLAPLAARSAALQRDRRAAEDELGQLRSALRSARAALAQAAADQQHLAVLGALEKARQRAARLGEYGERAAAERRRLADLPVDEAGLAALREAERALQLAVGKRDAVTSVVAISAERDLALSLDDEALELAPGTTEQRRVAAELRIDIPGVASIHFTPSASAAELEAAVTEQRERLDALLRRYAVADLAAAVAAAAQRSEAQRNLQAWRDRTDELLAADREADVEAEPARLQAQCDAYLRERPEEPPPPSDAGQAAARAREAGEALRACEAGLEAQESRCTSLGEDASQADVEHRLASQEVEGLQRDLRRREEQLEGVRTTEADAAIAARVTELAARVDGLQLDVERLRDRLESASPEAAEALMENAVAALARAEGELQERQREHAVLEDRLTQAQADGRFESLEASARELEELESRWAATCQRAAAAERLWQTLTRHRDATRRAYVRPLKTGIEQLGRIVFGADFTVELDDTWTLVSCTRNGAPLPFEALSVGAREQLGILTRLAAARIIARQGGVPLIIDDALGFSDPARLEAMGAAIAVAGRDTQVILLTCTPGRFVHVGTAALVRLGP